MKVLIVDHDSAFAAFLKEALESIGGYEVFIAPNGEEALAKVVEEPFKLAIVDMDLKDVKPEALIQAIKEVKPYIKILAIPVGDSPLPEGLGIAGIIPKPFFVGELPDILKKATVQKEEPALAPPPKETPPWLEEISRELLPELLVLGNPSDIQAWVGGTREEAMKLLQWAAKALEENPYGPVCPAEIHYRCEKGGMFGIKLRDGRILAAAFSRDVPPGMVRLIIKRVEGVGR
jgi:CheY-like chemotaxis protein